MVMSCRRLGGMRFSKSVVCLLGLFSILARSDNTSVLRVKEEDRTSILDSQVTTRIIGGVFAENSLPWVVLIDKVGGNKVTCTGSIIASRWIVTAAHCLLNARNDGYVGPEGTQIRYGCSDVASDSCKVANAVFVKGHPCFTPSRDQDHDDVALIRLDRDLQIDPVVVDGWDWGIVNLTEGNEISLAGFGSVSNQRIAQSQNLMRVDVPLASEEECVLATPWRNEKGYIHFNNIWCTGGAAGKDSCYGDSGGPAVHRYRGIDFLVGVLSIGSEKPAGSSCGVEGRYGLYTKLRHYSAWMRQGGLQAQLPRISRAPGS